MNTPCKILIGIICALPLSVFADDNNGSITPPLEMPAPRVSLFSTSTDWEAVTGLRLAEYRIKFVSDSRLVKNGLELYYLDGFPCYGQPDRTQIWMGQNGKTDRNMLITCLYAPEKITLAWRNAKRDASQGVTTGIMECPVRGERELTVDMSKCTVGKDWEEIK